MSSQTTCAVTGLHLIRASGEVGARVARTSLGALHVWPRKLGGGGWIEVDELGRESTVPWDQDPGWSRWDTPGRTLYVAQNARGAYAEVLQQFRRPPSVEPLAAAADAMGMPLKDYLAAIDEDWKVLCTMRRGHVPAAWRHDRALYELRMPASGWWIDVEHGDSLSALTKLAASTVPGVVPQITRAHLLGESRGLTVRLATLLRGAVLFDGSPPLGVVWESKLGYGRNWAFWMRRADDGLDPGSDDPRPIVEAGAPITENDPHLKHVAESFGLRVF